MHPLRRWIRPFVVVVWLLFFVIIAAKWWQSGLALSAIPDWLQGQLDTFGFWEAGLVYILIYTFRPLLFFPASLLTLISGVVFGPVWGILFTIVGENFSANLAFLVARFLGRQWVASHESEKIMHWDRRLQQNGLLTVLTLRLLMLPFDAVNYGCGLTSVRHRDFALGTFFGILPGLTSFVLAGSSLQTTDPLLTISLSLSILLLAYGLYRFIRLRELRRVQASEEAG